MTRMRRPSTEQPDERLASQGRGQPNVQTTDGAASDDTDQSGGGNHKKEGVARALCFHVLLRPRSIAQLRWGKGDCEAVVIGRARLRRTGRSRQSSRCVH